MYGKRGEGNVAHRCFYGKRKDRELLKCKVCGKKFSAERKSLFQYTRLPKAEVYKLLGLMCSGMGIRAMERETGIHRDTIMRLKRYAEEHFESVNEILLKDLRVSEIQLDEFWSYIKKKKKMPMEMRPNEK